MSSPDAVTEHRSGGDEKQAAAEKRDVDVDNVTRSESLDKGSKPPGKRKADKENPPTYDESLIKALNQCYFWLWWTAGILTLFASTCRHSLQEGGTLIIVLAQTHYRQRRRW